MLLLSLYLMFIIKQNSGRHVGLFDIFFDKHFHQQSMNVIKGSKLSKIAKGTWTKALKKGHSVAFLALLLCALLNLKEMLFGVGHILHYPVHFWLPGPMFGILRPP
jgi:hypothetical protein